MFSCYLHLWLIDLHEVHLWEPWFCRCIICINVIVFRCSFFNIHIISCIRGWRYILHVLLFCTYGSSWSSIVIFPWLMDSVSVMWILTTVETINQIIENYRRIIQTLIAVIFYFCYILTSDICGGGGMHFIICLLTRIIFIQLLTCWSKIPDVLFSKYLILAIINWKWTCYNY